MDSEAKWTYVPSGQQAESTIKIKTTFVLPKEALRARNDAVVAYLLGTAEKYKSPFSVDPVRLCEFWAEAWFEGRGQAVAETSMTFTHAPTSTPAMTAKPKRKGK